MTRLLAAVLILLGVSACAPEPPPAPVSGTCIVPHRPRPVGLPIPGEHGWDPGGDRRPPGIGEDPLK